MFEIGDRVCSIVNYPDDNQNIVIGSVGTVVNIDYNIICVEWDDDVEGHTCDGNAMDGHGWNVEEYQIELEDDGVQYEFDEDEFKRLIGF